MVQPAHSGLSLNSAYFTPRWFRLLLIKIKPFGQKLMHKRQPLHLSLLMVILAILPDNFSDF
jgi:hypothetical protein